MTGWVLAGLWLAVSLVVALAVFKDAERLGVPDSRSPGHEVQPLFMARLLVLYVPFAWPVGLPIYLYRRSRFLKHQGSTSAGTQ